MPKLHEKPFGGRIFNSGPSSGQGSNDFGLQLTTKSFPIESSKPNTGVRMQNLSNSRNKNRIIDQMNTTLMNSNNEIKKTSEKGQNVLYNTTDSKFD